jgi:single-stranded DNA-specific DHH superfamily exonuclease
MPYGGLPLPTATLDLVEQLERLAPFGAGNPPLVLGVKGLTLKGHSPIGSDSESSLANIR